MWDWVLVKVPNFFVCMDLQKSIRVIVHLLLTFVPKQRGVEIKVTLLLTIQKKEDYE